MQYRIETNGSPKITFNYLQIQFADDATLPDPPLLDPCTDRTLRGVYAYRTGYFGCETAFADGFVALVLPGMPANRQSIQWVGTGRADLFHRWGYPADVCGVRAPG